MKWILCFLFLSLICTRSHSAGRDWVPCNLKDSLPASMPGKLTQRDSAYYNERNDRFYDTIVPHYTRNIIPRIIYSSLFVRSDDDSLMTGNAVDESKRYSPFKGMVISRVDIMSMGLFSADSTRLERWASTMHVATREMVIRRDLLFRRGDKLDPEVMIKNHQNLRSRSYISDTETFVRLDPDNPNQVIVIVYTQDRWSISGDASLSMNGRTMLELYDANVLGYGSKFSVSNHFNWSERSYGGVKLSLDIPNILGSFFDATFVAGKNFENSTLRADINKQFILPTDYAAGVNIYDHNQSTYLLYADSSFQVRSKTLDCWVGGSVYMPEIRSSVFLTLRSSYSKYYQRPDVAPKLNPSFHNGRFSIMGAGLYREKFLTANLIYGYGHREYLATGYRAEILTGYNHGEFHDSWYLGLGYRLGGFSSIGYLMGSISAGSYISDQTGEWERTALKIESTYFTKLWMAGSRTKLRHFVNFSYLQGWNRFAGSEEMVTFYGQNDLRGISAYMSGANRTKLAVETVIFTPYQPYGFRIAMFTYADMGLLGNAKNPFKNTFYSTIGVGVRLKNERLIFNAVEFKLGIAIGRMGFLDCEYFTISNQRQVDKVRFRPEAPQEILFR